MQKRQIIIIAGLIVALLVLAAGCGWMENLQVFKSEGKEPPAENADPNAAQQTPQQAGLDTALPGPTNGSLAEDGESREIVLYFASSDGSSLEAETRRVPKQVGIARATVNELIAGPQDPNLNPTLPMGVVLEDININNGLCTVDFSGDLLVNLLGDETAQRLALYSVVNTLSQFDTVESVQILVDGQTIGSVGGVNAAAALSVLDF